MKTWRQEVERAADLPSLAEGLRSGQVPGVYGASVQFLDGQLLFLVRDQLEKLLVIVTKGANTPFAAESKTTMGQFTVHMAQLTSQNAKVLRSVVPWTAPQAFGREGISMGLGDRLGLA